jgi:hypothetical protein
VGYQFPPFSLNQLTSTENQITSNGNAVAAGVDRALRMTSSQPTDRMTVIAKKI